eukprot:snap_masked-scaffold_20-processed-gene-1.16-mRNA-1 protein AED:1.00 eAED:1.00 QI:0/-1/0/0/-1/1/1/0/71
MEHVFVKEFSTSFQMERKIAVRLNKVAVSCMGLPSAVKNLKIHYITPRRVMSYIDNRSVSEFSKRHYNGKG